ncbi:hypothetical protein QO002_005689 [Pararhizobium capsulatum DSM 1112]|uniref:Uncharacterized protein n=1 Tax=Pararhizobium capsulatum DSM 1112 TaxID=1121113 RepID=A0ABU0BZW1_9HYPH|nr:hypothetical protein [Pararhizobium capsulatum]MDQ0323483.1 hypothetical protein [Pararhizobium capsulatum DSM 1112]
MMPEHSIRSALIKQGLRLEKNGANSSSRQRFGVGYMVIDARTNSVVLGSKDRPYDASLDEVAAHYVT